MTGNSYMNEGNRSFYCHFTGEQQRIDHEVHDLQREVHEAHGLAPPAQMTDRLTRLREMMATHFLEEEEGCLDEIVAQRPFLARETKHLEQEHRQLLEELDALIEMVPHRETGESWKTRFDQFQTTLMRHERAERELVRRGLQLSEEDA